MNKKVIILSILAMTVLVACGTKSQEEKQVSENDYKIFVLNDAVFDGSVEILIQPDQDTLKKYIPDGVFPLYLNAFLLQQNGENLLFDTGVGAKLVENLANHGVTPEEIHKIFLTHAHFDHIGGLLKDGQAIFPNAELFINKIEHDYWLAEENPLFLEVIEKYKNQLKLFDIDVPFKQIAPGVDALPAYGHTPGHTMFSIGKAENRTLLWGDITHVLLIQMPHPQQTVSFDVNPEQAAEARLQVLKMVADGNITVAGAHIQGGLGKISENGWGGYIFQPLEK